MGKLRGKNRHKVKSPTAGNIKKSWYKRYKRVFKRLWILSIMLLIVIGLPLLSGLFFTKIEVSVPPSKDLVNPFSSAFELHNLGAFSIYDVELRCVYNKVVHLRAQTVTGHVDSKVFPKEEELITNGKVLKKCSFLDLRSPIKYADITLWVGYTTKLSFIELTKGFRFITEQNSDGSYLWNSKVLTDS